MAEQEITIELRYTYNVTVDVKDGDLEAAKDEAFNKACVEHAACTKYEASDHNVSDTWMAFDAETQEAI